MQVLPYILSDPVIMYWVLVGFIFTAGLSVFLIIVVYWIFVKGGIRTECLLLRSGGEWGRIYKAKEKERYIEFGDYRFLRRDTSTVQKKQKTEGKTKGKGKKEEEQRESKPLTFWKRGRARRLFVALEGQPVILDWRYFAKGLDQSPATAEEVKKSERQNLLRTGIMAFMSRVRQSKLFWFSLGVILIGLGYFIGLTSVLGGIVPMP